MLYFININSYCFPFASVLNRDYKHFKMENDGVAESNVIKAENGKELKFSEATTELQSGVKMYTWRLEPQNVKLRYDYSVLLVM